MAKGNRNVEQATEATSTTSEAQPTQSAQPSEATATPVSTEPNFMLRFKRNHPQNRSSYGIPGVPGIVVIQRDLFAGTTPPTSTTDLAGMPETIQLDHQLVSPRSDNKTQKAALAAQRLEEKAQKAKAKAEAQAAKLVERQQKAAASLKAAQEKAAAVIAKGNVDTTPQM